MEGRLRVRDPLVTDIPIYQEYWASQTQADYERLSLDRAKLPPTSLSRETVERRQQLPFSRRTHDVLIWELDGRAVGFSSLRNVRYGDYGEIHLHMMASTLRRSGYGHRFFALSLLEFFRRFDLQFIVCEPSSQNPGPNRLLQKLGFHIAKTYRAIPSPINLEHEVNRYEIPRGAAASLAAIAAKASCGST